MSKIRVDLESVQVTEGEGIGEGDFELRIQVQEGTNHMVWPSLNSSARIDKGGAACTINREIGTYSVGSGTLSKKFDIDVTEVDKVRLDRTTMVRVRLPLTSCRPWHRRQSQRPSASSA